SAVIVLHLTSQGACAPGWSTDGIKLAGAHDPYLSSDGAGGAFLGWTIWNRIAYRRMAGGAPFSADPTAGSEVPFSGGLPISPEKAPHDAYPILLPDGAGGTLIGWKQFYVVADKLLFERLDG